MNLHEVNVYDLQAKELIEETVPDSKLKKRVQAFAYKLKDVIDAIPESGDLPLSEWISGFSKDNVSYIYPYGYMGTDGDRHLQNIRLRYLKPLGALVVGSYLLDLSIGGKQKGVDILVPIPENVFRDKDYKDYRYYLKRNFYVCRIASALNSKKDDLEVDLKFCVGTDLNRITIKVLFRPGSSMYDTGFHFNINFGTLKPPFSQIKLAPDRSNIRNFRGIPNSDPTPKYNASILIDSSYMTHLEFLENLISSNPSIAGAIILLKIWMYQSFSDRGSSRLSGFIISLLLAYIAHSSSLSEYTLNRAMSPFQMFRAALKYISDINPENGVLFDISKNYKVTNSTLNLPTEVFKKYYDVVMVDITGGFNLCSFVEKMDILELRRSAQLGLECIQKRSEIESFRRLFLDKVSCYGLEYDVSLVCSCPSPEELPECIRAPKCDNPSQYERLCKYASVMFMGALYDRVKLAVVNVRRQLIWELSTSFSEESFLPLLISFGFVIDYEQSTKVVLGGPDLHDKMGAEKLRVWWGEKLEVRRFNDGSVIHCVVFDSKDEKKSDIVSTMEMIEYLIRRNLKIDKILDIRADTLNALNDMLLVKGCKIKNYNFSPIIEAVAKFSKDICSINTLPLKVKMVTPISPGLRYTSVFVPQPVLPPKVCLTRSGYASIYQDPNIVLLELQSSHMWPNDLNAIRLMKHAFYIKLAEEYMKNVPKTLARVSIDQSSSTSINDYIEIILPEGYAIRCYIFIPRERILIIKKMDDPETTDHQKVSLKKYLDAYDYYNRNLPFVSARIKALCVKYPVLSQTIRLVKRWISAHMLSSHISQEVIELICVNAFVNSAPYSPPNSPFTAFVRVLKFLALWNYIDEPLIVEFLNDSLSESEVESVYEAFNRKKNEGSQNPDSAVDGPTMWIFHEQNTDGSWWKLGIPTRSIAARLKAIAKTSFMRHLEIYKEGASAINIISEVFTTPYDYYDALVVMKPQVMSRYVESLTYSRKLISDIIPKHKNLSREPSAAEVAMCSIDVLSYYLKSIKHAFGDACMLFADIHGGRIIGIKWNRTYCSRTKLNANIDFNIEPCRLSADLSNKRSKTTDVDDDTCVRPNFTAMLSEIALLGEGVVKCIYYDPIQGNNEYFDSR